MILGVPVRCAFDRWIGRSASASLNGPLNRSDEVRLAMFRRLAWSMWSEAEIASGLAMERFRENIDRRIER